MHARTSLVVGRSGFTFLEVVATLVLLAILTVVVMVGIRNTHASVAAEANILRAHLRFSQAMAMANNTSDWSVLITDSSYTLHRDGLPSPINLPNENSPTHLLPAGVRIVGGAGLHSICEWGCPGGTVVITLSDGSHQQSVTLMGGTGLIP